MIQKLSDDLATILLENKGNELKIQALDNTHNLPFRVEFRDATGLITSIDGTNLNLLLNRFIECRMKPTKPKLSTLTKTNILRTLAKEDDDCSERGCPEKTMCGHNSEDHPEDEESDIDTISTEERLTRLEEFFKRMN